MSVSLTYLIRRTTQMPPHMAAYRAGRLAVRLLTERRAKRLVRRRRSYGPAVDGARLNRRLAALPELSRACVDRLLPFARLNTAHFYNLLGAGWINVHPGMACEGIEGVRFGTDSSEAAPPHQAVNRANRARAAEIYTLIDDPDYRPIDWQIDFRSGYRWAADTHFSDLPIGRTRGVDIKMPWELGRLQHLPRMALCAAAPSAEDVASGLHREARNQILDFIASNPPQFGASWGCPMDIGIRAANLCLAVDIFEQAGLAFDADFHQTLCASLTDHGRHIAANLEWAEEGRSNHYFSDLAGLAFIGAYLPMSDETLTWLAFALAEIADETLVQFHEDGGNYEGSVAYHRLSAEIVAYSLALALGLPEEVVARLRALPPDAAKFRRGPGVENLGRRAAAVASAPDRTLQARLAAIARFVEATAAPDGGLVQIGDMDSGRLFRLDVALEPDADDAGRPIESDLSVRSTVAALAALLSEKPSVPPDAEAAVGIIRALGRGRVLGHGTMARPQASATSVRQADVGRGAPLSERHYRLALPGGATAAMVMEAFPQFGLWVWRTPRLHLTFRCAAHDRADAPYGHTHDDNLAVTLWADGDWTIEDPGTYVYTSFPELRNAYRAAQAHFVPRAREWAAVAFDPSYLFDCRHRATARMIRADALGAEAELVHGEAAIRRSISWEKELLVVDRSWGCHLDMTIPAPAAPPAGRGYGRRVPKSRAFPAPMDMTG